MSCLVLPGGRATAGTRVYDGSCHAAALSPKERQRRDIPQPSIWNVAYSDKQTLIFYLRLPVKSKSTNYIVNRKIPESNGEKNHAECRTHNTCCHGTGANAYRIGSNETRSHWPATLGQSRLDGVSPMPTRMLRGAECHHAPCSGWSHPGIAG